jgi:ABC-type branched-subunit amino acid transport system ATPase component
MGLLATPAANATGNAILPSAISVGTIPTAAVGAETNIPVNFTFPSTTNADTFTITVRVTSAPTGSAFVGSAARGFAGTETTTAGSTYLTGVVAPANTVAAKLELLEVDNDETLQLGVLEPKIAILDELDSGLDIDALRDCARRVEAATHESNLGVLAITHYVRLLEELKPDVVHILAAGRIVKTAGPELADELERDGYAAFV